MPTLQQLKLFCERKHNIYYINIINKYYNVSTEDWCKNHYYLGGQLKLHITDNITDEHIEFVEKKNKASSSPVNSWEMASFTSALSELETMKKLLNEYKNTTTLNGLLRAICLWISPARKRAAEKVFHPRNLKKKGYFTDNELIFHKDLAHSHP